MDAVGREGGRGGVESRDTETGPLYFNRWRKEQGVRAAWRAEGGRGEGMGLKAFRAPALGNLQPLTVTGCPLNCHTRLPCLTNLPA